MQLDILAVGRLKNGPERDLFERYATRISRSGKSLHFSGPGITEVPESRAGDANTRKRDESAQLVEKMDHSTRLIVLDERGKDVTSQEFANILKTEQENGTSVLAFAIGGPDGHGEEVKTRAFRTIRFAAATWPHQLVRVMLAEQIYRAVTILSGHPYHRE